MFETIKVAVSNPLTYGADEFVYRELCSYFATPEIAEDIAYDLLFLTTRMYRGFLYELYRHNAEKPVFRFSCLADSPRFQLPGSNYV